MQPGEHRLVVRTVSGDEVEATVTLPGESVDLVVGARPRGGAKARRAPPGLTERADRVALLVALRVLFGGHPVLRGLAERIATGCGRFPASVEAPD